MGAAPVIEHLVFERVLGTGSFATVWLARDDMLDRHVAVKVLADNWSHDLEIRRRFLLEANVIITAASRRLSQGYSVGVTGDDRPYLVMAFADRGTLADRMTRPGRRVEPMPFERAAAIVRHIALALVDVHALGHLHRDVKPSNVLLMSDARDGMDERIAGLAPDERVVLGDFGLAKSLDSSALTLVAGSPGYMAPEQASGLAQLDARADVFPLGVILLELLTGAEAPGPTSVFAAAQRRVEVRHALDAAGVTIDHERLALVESLAATDPELRPATAADTAQRLRHLADPRRRPPAPAPAPPPFAAPANPVPAAPAPALPPPTGSAPAPAIARRRRATVVAAAVALMAVIALATLATVFWPDDTSDPTSTTTGVDDTTGSSIAAAPTASAPVPESAVVRSDSELERVAVVAATVDAVIAFYEQGPQGWQIEGDITSGVDGDDTARRFRITNGTTSATVTVTEAAASAAAGITEIVIRYG